MEYKGFKIEAFMGGFLVTRHGQGTDWMDSIELAKQRIDHRLSPLSA